MRTFNYDDREKHRQDWCDGCGRRVGRERLAPHHIYLRRYGDECIWLCTDRCHPQVDQDRAWAYEKGLLRHHNVIDKRMTKKKTKKKCDHKITYFDRKAGQYRCQFCGTLLNELRS